MTDTTLKTGTIKVRVTTHYDGRTKTRLETWQQFLDADYTPDDNCGFDFLLSEGIEVSWRKTDVSYSRIFFAEAHASTEFFIDGGRDDLIAIVTRLAAGETCEALADSL